MLQREPRDSAPEAPLFVRLDAAVAPFPQTMAHQRQGARAPSQLGGIDDEVLLDPNSGIGDSPLSKKPEKVLLALGDFRDGD